MPGNHAVFHNDNVQTEHLKCPRCRTRVDLLDIHPDGENGEQRVFGCALCGFRRLLHVAPRSTSLLRSPAPLTA